MDPQRPSFFKSVSSPGKLSHSRPSLSRSQSIKERITSDCARFFGVPPPPLQALTPTSDADASVSVYTSSTAQPYAFSSLTADAHKWQKRRFRHLKRQYGIKNELVAEELHQQQAPPKVGIDALTDLFSGGGGGGEPPTPTADYLPLPATSTASVAIGLMPRAQSMDHRWVAHSQQPHPVLKRESAAQIACEAFTDILRGRTWHRGRGRRACDFPHSTYTSIRQRNICTGKSSFLPPTAPMGRTHRVLGSTAARGVSEVGGTLRDISTRLPGSSAAVMAPPPSTVPTHRRPPMQRQEEVTDSLSGGMTPEEYLLGPAPLRQQPRISPVAIVDHDKQPPPPPPPSIALSPMGTLNKLALRQALVDKEDGVLVVQAEMEEAKLEDTPSSGLLTRIRNIFLCKWLTSTSDDANLRLKSLVKFQFSIRRNTKQSIIPTPNRRLPVFGEYKQAKRLDPQVERQLMDESQDYRPFFTYWITTVQLMVMLIMLLKYGIAFNWIVDGLGVIERSGDLLAPDGLTSVHIHVWEQNNVWLGPRFADLVHAGAKYGPCMRWDHNIQKRIASERQLEATRTGCCVFADKCVQASACPKQFARFIQSSGGSRVVCGQDPRYCLDDPSSSSSAMIKWDKENISNWPLCHHSPPLKEIPPTQLHMHCEITGRPCCIQMHGQCRITSKEYCDFVRGHYHPTATLCSQVQCLSSVCGITPFLSSSSSNNQTPDQLYRLITPLFIHAGLLRMAITAALQLTIMRKFETAIGWIRLSIIYFVSGVGGYLASAIFVPYMPEVGPAGSQGGVLGALIVNLVYNWKYIRNPWTSLLKHLGVAMVLLLTGLLPFIDNWAQLSGFVFGSLAAVALIPYYGVSQQRLHRIVIVSAALGCIFALLAAGMLTFWVYPPAEHPWLTFFNCAFGGRVCDQQGLVLKDWLPI